MMDVDEMFTIEEEIELDPSESLRRIEKKKEKKRKWRRKKREKSRQNEFVRPVIWNEEERTKKGDERDSLDDQGLAMEIKAKECSTANIGSFESNINENKTFAANDDSIDEELDPTGKDNDTQRNVRKDLDHERITDKNQFNQRMNVKAKERFTTNIGLFESNMNTEDSENCAENDDCIDVNVDHQLEEKNIQPHVIDTECVLEKTQNNQSYNEKIHVKANKSSAAIIGIVESNINLDTEESEDNLIQENDGIKENQDQSNSHFVNTEFKILSGISSERKQGETEMAVDQDRTSIENDNTADCEDNESIEHLYNEVTITDILEEVKQTESELEEARTLLAGGRSDNTYLCNPSASLEGNVLEYDEESQDSTIFKDTDDNESSSMCVQTLTLHHKIIYGMEEIRGTKQDNEMVDSLVDEQCEKDDGSEDSYEVDGGGIIGNYGGSDGALADERSSTSTHVVDSKDFDSGNDYGGSERDGMVVLGRNGASIHVSDGKDFDGGSGDNDGDGGDTRNDSDGGNDIVSRGMGIVSAQSGSDAEFDDCSGSNNLYDGGEDTGSDYDGSEFIVAYGDSISVGVGDAKESGDGSDADDLDVSDGSESDHNNSMRIFVHGGDTAVGADENDGNFNAGNGSNDVEELGKDCDDGDYIDGNGTDHDAGSSMETDLSEQKHEAPDDQYLFNVENQTATEEVTERVSPETDDDIHANMVHSYHDMYLPDHKNEVTGIDQNKEQSISNTDVQKPTQDISMDRHTDDVFEVNLIESNVEATKSDETAEYEASKSETRSFGEDHANSAEDGSSEAKFDRQNFENNGVVYSLLLQEGKEIKEEGISSGKEQQAVELTEIKEIKARERSSDKAEQSVAGDEVKENLEKLSDVYKSSDMMEKSKEKENIDEKEEGELTSSSDEENLDLGVTGKVNNKKFAETKQIKSVDVTQRPRNLERNKSKYTNLQQEKKHNLLKGSESHVKKSIVGQDETSSIKAQKAGGKKLYERRHSIASTRERNCKAKDKSEHKLEKQRRQSLGERVLDNSDRSSRIARTKDDKERQKISDSKERKSDKDNTKTSEKRQRSGTDQKLDTSSTRNDTRGKESTARSKSITSRYGADSAVEKNSNSSEKMKGTVSDSKLQNPKKEVKPSTQRCGKQQRETQRVRGSGDKMSRLNKTRPKEAAKVANTSKDSMKSKDKSARSETFTKLISNSKKTESGNKRSKVDHRVDKTCSKESGNKVKLLSNTKSSSTPKPTQDGSSSESFTKQSKRKKESESEEKEHQLDRTQVGKSGHKTFPNTRSKTEDSSKSSMKSIRKTSSGSEASSKHSSKYERGAKSGREQREVTKTSKSNVKSERKTRCGSEASIKHSSKCEPETKSRRELREVTNTSKSSVKSKRKTSSGSEASIKDSSKCKQETKSGREHHEVTSTSRRSVKSKRESSSNSEFVGKPSSNKEDFVNKSSEDKGKQRENVNTRRSSNPSVKTRIVRVSDKNERDLEERKCDTKKSIAKTKEETDSEKTAPEERAVLAKRKSSGLKSRDNSSVKRESSSLKRDSFRTGKREERKVSSEKDSLEKNVREKEKISSSNNEKSNYKQGNKLKPLKNEQSLSKSTRNKDERNVESSKRTSTKDRGLSSDEKSLETKKQSRVSKSESNKDKTQRSTEITGNVEKESAFTKIVSDKSLKKKKGTSSHPNEESKKTSINSDKQKDNGVKTTTKSIVQKDKTETPEGKAAVAKRKLTMDEYKRTTRLRSKQRLDSSKEKITCNEVNNKADKPKQPKTLKQSENVQKTAKSKSLGQSEQICDENTVRLPRKRKRDDTPVRPRKAQKTTKMEPNERRVKTKEAKLPGKVITERILKVDRGKALVLKRRHVNQLFIRGDNIIMVAYENVDSSEIKL